MKNRKSFIKRTVTWLVLGSGLLVGGLLVSGIALRGPAGLNLFAWGLVLAPLTVALVILRACLPFLTGKVRGSTKRIPQAIETKGNGTRPVQIPKSTKPTRMTMGSALAVISNMEEREEHSDTEETDYLNPPRESVEAHFNWSTGQYDAVRGIGGAYDPPYDPTKG